METTDTPADTAVEEPVVTLHPVPAPAVPDPSPADLAPVPDRVDAVATGAATVDSAASGAPTAGEPDGEPAADVREQARAVWRKSATGGEPLTGEELAQRFGRSERWGRARIAEARADGNGTNGTGGTHVPARRRRPRADTAGRRRVAPAAETGFAGTNGTPSTAAPETTDVPPAAHPDVAAAVAAVPAGDVAGDGAGRAQDESAHDVPPAPVVPASVPVPELLGGARLVAWAGFAFGTVISVAANVLHAWLPTLAHQAPAPGIAPQVGAAVWPIALVISVEVLSRVPWRPGFAWLLARYGGAGVVALGAAVISYGHLHGVLAAWGYGALGAAVGPLVVDGLMTISGFALLAMSGHGKAARS